MINLGDLVEDRITGLRGIVDARSVYLFEEPNVRIIRREKKDDGGPPDAFWLPESRFRVIEPYFFTQDSTVKSLLDQVDQGAAEESIEVDS